ncbi:MAG: DsrE family protein [Sulfuritalea sp.]|nr:DsrE family protein [Sulfuritalea sp.]
MIRRLFIQLMLASAIFAVGAPVAMAAKTGVVIQVSDSDPKTWNQALNVIKNVQAAGGTYTSGKSKGKFKTDVQLVVFGMGSGMLKFDSPLAGRIDETLGSGAQVVMCQNTMKGQKLTEADMHPKIGYVNAGVIEIINKSKKGWTVVRP